MGVTIPTQLVVTGTGWVVNTVVGGNNISAKVPVDSIEIESSGNQSIGSCSFDVIDKNMNTNVVTDKAFVNMWDANGDLFRGLIDSRTPEPMAIGRRFRVQAHGIESLLDTIIVVQNARNGTAGGAGESDKARIQYFLQTYCSQGLWANYASLDFSKIQTLNPSMPNQKFKNMTLRQVIESILGLASPSSDYYVDPSGRIHTFDSTHKEPDAAPYIIRLGNPAGGETAPSEMEIDFDSQSLINDYYVRAKDPAFDVRRTDPPNGPNTGSMNTYGRFAAFVDAPDADTLAKANAIGDAALTDNSAPKVRGHIKIEYPYDLNGSLPWKVGQYITFYSTVHNLSGAQSRIVGVNWKYQSGDGKREADINFGGGRLRLRGTADNTVSQTGTQGAAFVQGTLN